MLTSITSAVLRSGSVAFHEGLNVVLGDENATNSIGKSSLLMIVDFAFGGSDLLKFNTDLVTELGHHHYDIRFAFSDGDYLFRRSTDKPDLVYILSGEEGDELTEQISVEKYRAFLAEAYNVESDYLTFRALVSLYARIWGKDNLDVRHPLHTVQRQAARECVDNLLKTYGRYAAIAPLDEHLRHVEANRKAIRAAIKREVIPKVGKRDFTRNAARIAELQAELGDIKRHLAEYATNLSQVVDREVLELKEQRDDLTEIRFSLQNRLNRLQRDIRQNRHIKSKNFDSLRDFFPEIDEERLAEVEEFHNDLAKLLRRELRESERRTARQIAEIDEEVRAIDERMKAVLGSVEQPSLIVDRVVGLATGIRDARKANEQFERQSELDSSAEETKAALQAARQNALSEVQTTVNEGMRAIVSRVFGPDRKSPTLSLGETAYSFQVFEDTGTGTAYSSLVVFDLTVFGQTSLPVLIHDSILFKNIENDSVARLMAIYDEMRKQSFVAIDESEKYGPETAQRLHDRAVERLSDARVLFIKDWREAS